MIMRRDRPMEANVHIASLRLAGQAVPSDLCDDDRTRLSGMPRGPARDRFLAGRNMIRSVLGSGALKQLRARPGERPLVAAGPSISLSHCSSHVALAVMATGPLGVDIERADREIDIREVADLSLTPRERRLLDRLAVPAGRRRFLGMWTRKEAVMKALGTGLRLAPNLIETLAEDETDSPVISGLQVWTTSGEAHGLIISIAVHHSDEDALRVRLHAQTTASLEGEAE